MEFKGAKTVSIVGLEDKRQLSLEWGVTAAGDKLPPTMVYEGKTKRVIPTGFPA